MHKKNFNKENLVEYLSFKTGFSKYFTKKLIDDLINIIINNIKNGDLILKNIGAFKIIKKKQRIGRNPKTKEEFTISSRKSVKFILSKKITKHLDKIT